MRSHGRHEQGQILMLSMTTLVVLSFLGLAIMQLGSAAQLRENILYRKAQADWRVKGTEDYALWQLVTADAGSFGAAYGQPGARYFDQVGGAITGASLTFPLEGQGGADASDVGIEITQPDESHLSLLAVKCETDVMGKNSAARQVIDVIYPPPALAMALLTEGSVKLAGGATVQSYSTGEDTLNADVHTNGDLIVQGTSRIYGFASASGTVSAPTGSIIPPVNPDGVTPYYEGVDEVSIPDVDPAAWASDDYVHSKIPNASIVRYYGDQYYSNDTIVNLGGTKDNPVVCYIEGDLHMSAKTTFAGYTILVVNGDVHLNTSKKSVGSIGTLGGSFGVYCNNMHLAAYAKVYGLAYVREHFHLTGQAAVYGAALSKGYDPATGETGSTMEMLTGKFDIYYRPTDESVFVEGGKPKKLSYQQRSAGQDW